MPDLGQGDNRVELPAAHWVEIDFQDDGYFMFYLDENLEYINDGWHQTLEEAMHQGEFEYEITQDDWVAIDEDDPTRMKYH